MAFTIPSGVYNKYIEAVDSTIDIFGVNCKIVFPERVEEIDGGTTSNPEERRSMNSHRRGNREAYSRGDKTFRTVETTQDIKLKVYWNPKNWIDVGYRTEAPDNTIQTIGHLSDLPRLRKASELIVHSGIDDYGTIRFERQGEHYPIGLQQDRYVAMFWRRI